MEKITDDILLTDYNPQRCATVLFVSICNFGATCRITFLLNVYLNVCCWFLKNTHRGFLVCPWSTPWRLRPQTPSMRNVLTTTEKGFCVHACVLRC